MRHSLTFVCCLVLCCFVIGQDKDEAGRKELIRFQGEWKLTAGQTAGQALPPQVVAGFSLVIRDNQYEFRNSEETEKGTLQLQQQTNPAKIDITILDGSYKGQKQLGIYDLSENKLKICLAQPGEMTRPEKYESTPQNQFLIFEFERVKK